jgi:CRISPR/Cas system CMR subunit Cmr4 (Cas7 group RAMP superfamily)
MSHLQHIHIAKLVIETTSPMAINSGQRETGFDAELARDASGLPTIPATAIAGVWSHIIESITCDKEGELAAKQLKERWFGNTDQSSSLTISNGRVHNSNNQPVSALLNPVEIAYDSLLTLLASPAPLHRERVSLNDRGVAKDKGKFDQVLLPTGTRFSITLRFDDRPRKDKETLTLEGEHGFKKLFEAWFDPRFAFGSSTRNGLGKIKIIAGSLSTINLENNIEASAKIKAALGNQPQSLDTAFENNHQTNLLASLPLQALDNWRCGTGSDRLNGTGKPASPKNDDATVIQTALPIHTEKTSATKKGNKGKKGNKNKVIAKAVSVTARTATISTSIATSNPSQTDFDNPNEVGNIHSQSYSEKVIEWDGIASGSQSTLSKPKAILCGSSIKGILAHRIAFHYRKHEEIWAESMADCTHEEWETRPNELKDLLGLADATKHENSAAGKLWVDDCELEFEHTVVRTHNQIDRFTGGVRKGALYTEELLYQPRFTLKLFLDPSAMLSNSLGNALKDTLYDIELGLLPIGAGSGRGNSLVLPDECKNNKWLVNSDFLTGDAL